MYVGVLCVYVCLCVCGEGGCKGRFARTMVCASRLTRFPASQSCPKVLVHVLRRIALGCAGRCALRRFPPPSPSPPPLCGDPGLTLEQVPLLPGVWRGLRTSRTMLKCRVEGSCVGGAGLNASGYCRPRHGGPLCEVGSHTSLSSLLCAPFAVHPPPVFAR